MGKNLNKVLGRRGFKANKFKPLATLSLSRLSVLKLQSNVRSTQANNDVVQLLRFGHHERALLRVEHVIKERNMMDAYAMIEGYCNLLLERADLIQDQRECPEELKEATSTIIYSASRCGDFPELQEIRSNFTSHFGKEFATRAVELRNNCGVNVKMIMKLSTRQPSLETRMKVLQEIATENGMSLDFEGDSSSSMQENKSTATKADHEVPALGVDMYCPPEISQASVPTRKFKDVADAAQAAFESAAHAASAARAAVELSRSVPQDPDHQTGAHSQETKPVEELADSISDEKVSSIGNLTEDRVTAEEVKRCSSLSISDVVDVDVRGSVGQEDEIVVENSGLEKESEDKEEILCERSPMEEKENEKSEEIELQSKDSEELNSPLPAYKKTECERSPMEEKENEKIEEIELQRKDSEELNSPLPAYEKTEPKPWFPFQKHIRLKLQAGRKAPQSAAASADQATSMRQKIGFKVKPFFAGTREVRGY